MKKKLKHLQTFEQSTDKNLNISDVIVSENHSNKINTTKKVRFTSDRGRHKYDDFYMTEIVFENDDVCLCKSDINELILFDKNTREVLTKNVEYGNYYAENIE